MKEFLVGILLLLNLSLTGTTYYVATDGNDNNPGTISSPFASIEKAWSVVSGGDLIYLRGGKYYRTESTLLSNKNGSNDNLIKIWNYPGESPVIDFGNINLSSQKMALKLSYCSYIHFKGLRVTNMVQPSDGKPNYGILIQNNVNNCVFENMEFDHIGGMGLVIGDNCDDNLILNCDSHHNQDPYSADPYGNADGFECGSATSDNNVFRGCRAWWNSDDGFDFRHTNGFVTFDNCWAFWNGYIPDTFTYRGNGIGFKLGNKQEPTVNSVLRQVTNCLAFENYLAGFDHNFDNDNDNFRSLLYNCTAYKNGVECRGYGFYFSNYHEVNTLRNNIDYANGAIPQINTETLHDHNSWDIPINITDNDFLSLDPYGIDGARQPDGSLPDISFLKLAEGSDLIDAGTDVGLPYNGEDPDLGAFETGATSTEPPVPSYESSEIENSAPSVIEMSYNLTLATIVPAISSFSVQVNSIARSVTTVAVSGTKVMLTLSSPAATGNVVTVSYTVPSSNPLQTAAGGIAASIASKSVTNRINAPISPVYVSSAVENATPSVIEMTYNLSLANIVPAASAFSVKVNSATRNVSSVAVSGTKVLLTIASPVVNGNSVTVAYTKPSASPLQTSSGGHAATISAQTVTNKVNAVSQPVVVVTPPAVVNTPPVVVVNNISGTFSGFIGTLNASGSYDANKDNITYAWNIPGNIPVSATNSPIIEFLAPIVDVNKTFVFTLTVSDGKNPQTKTVPVTIMPYEPELGKADVISVEAVSFQSPYNPSNILDGNVGTMWSVNGNDQWIILELDGTYGIQHVELAFQPGQKKEFYFDIYGSNDKENWEPVLSKSRSCAFSGNLQVFEFPTSKTEKEFRYVKLVGQGNSTDTWNYVAEFRIFGNRHNNPVDYEDQIVKIFPNPAHELVNILIDESTFMPDFIKIVSLTGKVLFNNKIDSGTRQFQIPVDFKQGIYVIQMGTGDLTVFTQKLIVTN